MKLLTFTTLYPNAVQPGHGIFVENRVARVVADGRAVSRVVAPIPYVPNIAGIAARHARLRQAPQREERRGLTVDHPRYFLLPKISMTVAPFLLYLAAKRRLTEIIRAGYDFDLIDAHYFYPDGVAAILLGRYFKRPVTITARGSDITLIATYRLPGAMIRWAADKAAGIVTVCQALKDSLAAIGVPPEKVRVLRNGVALDIFTPGDRKAARQRLDFGKTTLLSVGHLIPRKGHDLAIEALALLEDRSVELVIVGEGSENERLPELARRIGVADRVRFAGQVPHGELPDYYRAADALLLMSTHEGWANVLLEALACGTPVVATNVDGTPEVVTQEVGELVLERTPVIAAQAIERLLGRNIDRQAVRTYAEGFSWDATTRGQLELFEEILAARRSVVLDGAPASARVPS